MKKNERGDKKFKWDGKKMSHARIERGLSLQALGDEVGTSKSYVWEIENDRSQPTIGYAYHISQILKKPISFFMKLC